MKRSEMVKIICDCLPNIEHVNTTPELLASFILERIEKLGMLPPKNMNKYNSVPSVTPTGNLDYSHINEWESEDVK